MIKRCLTILFFLFTLGVNAKAAVTLKAEILPKEITLEDEATITLTVEGHASLSAPQAPKIPGLDIVHTGSNVMSGSSFSIIINGQQIQGGSSSTSASFLYTVVPSDAGEFTIPPFVVEVGGKEYHSNVLKLKVTGVASGAPPPNFGNPFQNTPQQAPQGENKAFWIVAEVSNTNPVVHEQILYRLKLYSRVNGTIVDYKVPEFTDFLVEPLVEGQEGKEMVAGQSYSTYEIIYSLVPLKSGELSIGKANLTLRHFTGSGGGSLDPFFNDPIFNRGSIAKNSHLSAAAIPLVVKDLPLPVPADFTNLVGRFSASAALSDQNTKVGETITYTVTLTGIGNIKDAILPDWEIVGAKVYTDKPDAKLTKSEAGIQGSKTFKMAIVPSASGDFSLPARSLSYYDTTSGRYETLTLDAMSFNVAPSEKEDTKTVLSVPQDSHDKIAEAEIAPLMEASEEALSGEKALIQDSHFILICLALPGVLFVALSYRLFSHGFKKASEAKGGRKARFYELEKILSRSEVTLAEILLALRTYLACYSQHSGHALTAPEMEELCCKHGAASELAKQLRQRVEDLEAKQYGFNKSLLLDEEKKTFRELMRKLHGQLY